MEPTKYRNLWKTNGLFQYIYAEDNFKIEARDWNDLKFKLAIQGIKLQEKTEDEKNKITVKKIHKENKTVKKQIKQVTSKSNQPKPEYKKEPLKKNKDYIESEEDVCFGKIHYAFPDAPTFSTWGPDNSKRARKLREELIR